MNLTDSKYAGVALVKEMLETPDVIRNFDPSQAEAALASIQKTKKLFLTGEGSSRIFPAKNMMFAKCMQGLDLEIITDGSRQAAEYKLSDYTVFGASNSGQTKEVISLFTKIAQEGCEDRFGLTANAGTKLAEVSKEAYVLTCGKEDAVAATKSVAEQALFYHSLLCRYEGKACAANSKGIVADAIKEALTISIDSSIVDAVANSNIIHWAGRNTGVAEELTLKTNEITRKRSAYLEGTYAVHGIEEVMTADDVVIIVEPFESEEAMFEKTLVDGVGLKVVAISSRQTRFPTIQIPSIPCMDTYIRLAAGWNLLVEVGLALNVNVDKPVRARKVGNQFEG